MQIKNVLRSSAVIVTLVAMTGLAACGDNAPVAGTATPTAAAGSVELSGQFAGAGATSQQSAVQAWIAGFNQAQPDATVAYDPTGSGAGVNAFLAGADLWAGTDVPLTADQSDQSKAVCQGQAAFDLPVYISPIAVVYNLKSAGLNNSHLNLSAQTIAKLFAGQIVKWNDPAIKAENPKIAAKLPDLAVTPVWRSDKSGTTENFTAYLKDASDGAWAPEPAETWPNAVGEGAKGTSGVVSTVTQAEGTIGYADASQSGGLGTVAVKVGSAYVPFSAKAASAVVDASPRDAQAAGKGSVVIKVDHTTTAKGVYPLVLVSYMVACPVYKTAQQAAFIKDWLTYVVSAKGQAVAAQTAGSAPLSAGLRAAVLESVKMVAAKK